MLCPACHAQFVQRSHYCKGVLCHNCPAVMGTQHVMLFRRKIARGKRSQKQRYRLHSTSWRQRHGSKNATVDPGNALPLRGKWENGFMPRIAHETKMREAHAPAIVSGVRIGITYPAKSHYSTRLACQARCLHREMSSSSRND